jgi:sugar O-acyltransferase (sialic acid O-acetyltransferase NeuD family)
MNRSNVIKFVCLGAQNPETVRSIHAIVKQNPKLHCLGYIDNDNNKWGVDFFGYPVFGGYDKVTDFVKKGIYFCNFVAGTSKARYESTKEIVSRGAKLINLIHPSVNLEMVTLGLGNYIQEQVVLQAGVSIGDNSSIHIGTLVGHETQIGNSVMITHGCNISGSVIIKDGAYLGTGATILPKLQIGKWSILGAGSVIIKDVPPYSVVVGNPGRIIKRNNVEYKDGKIF